MLLYILSFVLAVCLCLYMTPFVIEAAIAYEIVDHPDGRLKNHRRPVAYLGGLAVYLSFLFTLSLTFTFSREVLGLLLGGTIVILIGIIDDLRPLGPKLKLAGQAVAVFVLIKSGIFIQIVFIPPPVCIALTFIWLMATINAFNIIDIMDGLSAGSACIIAGVLFVVSVLNERAMIAIMAVTLAGALLGFLRFNFRPARIYLGDTGSMFLGLMLGSLAMIGSYTENNMLGCLAPPVILGVPLFDTAFVMYVRWRNGRPVMQGSPDHFALRLRRWKLTTEQTVVFVYGMCLMLGALGIAMMLSRSAAVPLAVVGVLGSAFLAAGYFLQKIVME